MCAFCGFVFNIVLLNVGLTVVRALDVRIETIEDDGARDVWTFENDSLKSQLLNLSVCNLH